MSGIALGEILKKILQTEKKSQQMVIKLGEKIKSISNGKYVSKYSYNNNFSLFFLISFKVISNNYSTIFMAL